MTTYLSDPSLRFIIFDALEGEGSLSTYNTSKSPNGARAFVNDNGVLYQFYKFSSAVADGSTVIAPGGGPGRWIAVASEGSSSPFNAQALSNGTVSTGAVVANTWAAIGDLSYSLITDGDLFSINATTGVVTYTGPDATYFFTATFTCSAGGPLEIEAAVSSQATGVLLGTTSSSTRSNKQTVPDDNEVVTITTYAYAQIVSGNTFRGVIRTPDDGVTLSTQKFSLNFIRAR